MTLVQEALVPDGGLHGAGAPEQLPAIIGLGLKAHSMQPCWPA